MTIYQQPQLECVTTPEGRMYVDTEGNGYTSVTTALHALPKEYIHEVYKPRQVARFAVEHAVVLVTRAERPDEAEAWLVEGCDVARDKAGATGTLVHDRIEGWWSGTNDNWTGVAGDKTAAAMWVQFQTWASVHDVHPVVVEAIVWSRQYGYAGRLDAIVDLDGVRTLLDVKTGKSVRESVRLQLAAYRYADDVPEVEQCAVLHVRPRSCRLTVVEAGEQELTDFRYCLATQAIGRQYTNLIVEKHKETR